MIPSFKGEMGQRAEMRNETNENLYPRGHWAAETGKLNDKTVIKEEESSA